MAFLVFLLACLALSGTLPGLTNSLSATTFQEGPIQCLANQGFSHFSIRCSDVGLPVGQTFSEGLPIDILGFLLTQILGVSAHLAFIFAGMIITAVALWGATALLGRIGVGYLVGLTAASLYIVSPTLLAMTGFGSTYWAFLLIPAVAYMDLRFFELWPAASTRRRLVFAAAWLLAKTVILFMDGYTFVMTGVVTVVLFVFWAARRVPLRPAASALATVIAANGVAYAAYQAYVPGGDYAQSPIDLFRSMGLDAITLVKPSSMLWWSRFTKHTVNSAALWGDGSNSVGNYLGLGCLLLAILGAVLAFRRQRRAVLVLAICGLIGLVMSFGPSLKIDDTRPPTTGNPTAQSYLMPKADATLSLPTALLDENAPGFSLMRATYRWFVLTRWALIALAALGVQQLISRALRSRRPWPALIVIVALGVLSVLELLPNPSQTLHNYRAWENERKQTLAVATDLKHSLPAGSKVAFLVGTSAANDYLANLLVPAAGLRSYNVGVDKSVAISSASWPKEIRQLIQGPNASGALGPALHDGLVNAVIIPKFDLRWSSYSWPPAVEYQQRGIALATQVSANPDFKVVDHKWFYIVTLRQ